MPNGVCMYLDPGTVDGGEASADMGSRERKHGRDRPPRYREGKGRWM